MSKSKKALVNTALVALIMIVYRLLINHVMGILQYVLLIAHNLILFSALILIWGKNKYLLEKPLFDKSLPFAKRFNIGKLVLAFVISALSYLLNYITAIINFVVCPNFDLRLALSGLYLALFWIVLYFVIAGKGCNIFKKPKYAVISLVVILLATAVRTIVDIGYIRMINVQSGNITDYIEMLEYSTRMGYLEVLSSIIVICTLVFFHTLSVPEEVPLETSNESAEVTE